MNNKKVTLDIVIPVYNEEDMLGLLLKELYSVFNEAEQAKYGLCEVRYIFIDDGSTDSTAAVIAHEIKSGGLNAVLYRFSRNFGHQNAVCAGYFYSDADLTAVIDADLQDPPGLIPEMLAKWREGYNIVFGIRQKRRTSFVKNICYWLYYRMVRFLSDIDIPLDCGDFCLVDSKVRSVFNELPEKVKVPRILRAWIGFRQTGLEYERPERLAGTTKYSFAKLYRLATDGLTSASVKPLKVAQLFCILYLLLIFFILLLSVLLLVFFAGSKTMLFAFIMTNLFVALGGLVTSANFFVVNAYIRRMYMETKNRPGFVVSEIVKGRER